MIRNFIILILIFGVFCTAQGVAQISAVSVKDQSVLVCPATHLVKTDEVFEAADCEQMRLREIDPQYRALWVRASLEVPEGFKERAVPTGFYLSLKASSSVWLNGQLIGENGSPGLTRGDERVGRIDQVFYVPPDRLVEGENELVMLVSSHHSILRLREPLHTAVLGAYASPRWRIISHYWPSLLTFGLFFVGFLYFGTFAILRQDRIGSVYLSLASGAAGGQLLSEVSRGLWGYPYPFHDIRLVLILFFAALFGLSILGHTAHQFRDFRPKKIVLTTILLTFLTLIFARGFDGMTMVAIVGPCLGASLIAGIAAWRGQKHGWGYAGAYLAFLILVIITPFSFLDKSFYFLVAGLSTFLFVQQAKAYRQKTLDHAEMESRRRQLEEALAKTAKAECSTLMLRSSGKMQRFEANNIASASGAGDYVELAFANGDPYLHSGTLSALEKQLPPHFLRVHRSHIVNTRLISELRRLPSGTGELILSTGHLLPVSKRIMPRVREVLDDV